jgi:hypothetical protein
VIATIALMTAAVVSSVLVVMLSAMLGSRDPLSPFERLRLLICTIIGLPEGDCTLPASGCPSSGPERSGAYIRKRTE